MADKASEPKTSSKEFSLKPIETQLLNVIVQQQQALLSNTVSFIAIERLAINVTPQTSFNLSEDLTKVTVVETEAEPAEGEIIEQPNPPKKG